MCVCACVSWTYRVSDMCFKKKKKKVMLKKEIKPDGFQNSIFELLLLLLIMIIIP